MVVVRGLLAGILGECARVLVVEILNRRRYPLPLFEQSLAEPIRFDRAHFVRSFPAAEERRRSI